VLRGVGFDLCAIERDMAQLDEARRLAQMQNLLEQFSREIAGAEEPLNVAATAEALAGFIRTMYEQEFPDPQKRPILGFLIGGYDNTSPFAQEWGFEFPATPKPQEILPPSANKPVFGVNWFGQTDALVRLMLGFDARMIQGLKDKGFDPAKVDEFFTTQNLWASKIPYEVIFDGMPLQDAVDYAAYLVHVVKGRFRFVVGPKVCGGPVDIAVLKPGKFEWIRKKTLSHDHEI